MTGILGNILGTILVFIIIYLLDEHKSKKQKSKDGTRNNGFGHSKIEQPYQEEFTRSKQHLGTSGIANKDYGYQKKSYTTLKKDASICKKILEYQGISRLYHFTDSANIGSIINQEALLSWKESEKIGLNVPNPGGNSLSRDLDTRKDLEDYVRLCFIDDHPMLHFAQKEGRIIDPVWIEVDPIVALWDNTLFSNMNATSTQATIGPHSHNLQSIRFDVIFSRNWKHEDKWAKQAEVLVRTKIPIEFVLGIYGKHNSFTFSRPEFDDTPY